MLTLINLLFLNKTTLHVQFIPNTLVAACTRGRETLAILRMYILD